MTTAVFGVLDALLLAPLPYPSGDRLREVRTVTEQGQRLPGLSPQVFRALRNETTTFSVVEGYQFGAATLTGGREPVMVSAPRITLGLLNTLGVRPSIGRLFGPNEQSVVLISERLWIAQFGRADDAIGRRIQLDNRVETIVGVLPASFGFPEQRVDVWRPLDAVGREPVRGRVQTVVLPLSSMSQQVADEQLKAIVGRFHSQNLLPREQVLETDDLLQRRFGRENGPALYSMFGAVALLLLVACANVTSLLLARASSRSGEFAVLNVLGAAPSQLLAYMMTEAFVLAFMGGVAGILTARFLLTWMLNALPENMTLMRTVTTLNWRAFSFAFVLATVVAVLIGVVPAFRALRGATINRLRARTLAAVDRQDDRWQAVLVTVQLAMMIALLWGAGLLTRSFTRLVGVEPGFEYHDLLVFEIQLPQVRYAKKPAAGVTLFEQLDQAVENRWGIHRATFSNGAPPRGGSFSFDITPEAEGEPTIAFDGLELPHAVVAPDYFSLMGIRLREGRSFRRDDPDNVVVVNEVLARRLWHGHSPIGRRFRLNDDQPWHTVIGVVADVKQMGPADPMGDGMELYFPYTSASGGAEFFTFIVRAPANQQAAVTEHVRRVLRDLDAGLPILEIATMEQRLSEAVGRERFLLSLTSVFASCAFLLAAVGVYGTTTYWIARRRRDLGIRMALGATSRAIMNLVLGRSLRISLVGGCAGLLMSVAAGRIIRSLLFQTQVGDIAVLLTTVGAFIGMVLLSCMIPVFSAVRTDPAIVLRSE